MKTAMHVNSPTFQFPVRVYYEDTDAGGVVYHSMYLNFMERARTEWLRSLGFEQDQLARGQGVLFVVRSLGLDYLKAARFNDLLSVQTSIGSMGKASIHFHHTIWRQHPQNQPGQEHLVSATVRVACVDATSFRPKAIPVAIKGALDCDH